MKKTVKLFVSLILCLSVVLSLASCESIKEFIDKYTEDSPKGVRHSMYCTCCTRTKDGYTGGVTDRAEFHEEYGVYWLETYDEVLEAIELLKSHGSTITCKLGFDYEGELFDSKYCFLYEKEKADPQVEGKNFFDRRIDSGSFSWFGFYNDITIEELMYHTDVYSMDVAHFSDSLLSTSLSTNYEIARSVEDTYGLSFCWSDEDGYFYQPDSTYTSYNLFYNNEHFAGVEFEKPPLFYGNYEELLNTFVVIE